MRAVIFGSRDITDRDRVDRAIARSGFPISGEVCGDAAGVDTLGRLWAEERAIPVFRFPADWDKHGRKAGPIRNQEMVEHLLSRSQMGREIGGIAVWEGTSPGTRDMLKRMLRLQQVIPECRLFEDRAGTYYHWVLGQAIPVRPVRRPLV